MEIIRRRPVSSNACARALTRIHRTLAALDCIPCHVCLTTLDEAELRDCTEAQLGIAGVLAAREGRGIWRRFLVAHFQRYLVEPAFDSPTLHSHALLSGRASRRFLCPEGARLLATPVVERRVTVEQFCADASGLEADADATRQSAVQLARMSRRRLEIREVPPTRPDWRSD
jgi:hypothetical protein